MYIVSNNFRNAIEDYGRKIRVRSTFNSSTVLYGDNIIDINYTGIMNTQTGITMGDVCSSNITMNIIPPASGLTLTKKSTTIYPEVGVDIDNDFDTSDVEFSFDDYNGGLYVDSPHSTSDISFSIVNGELYVETNSGFEFYDEVFFSLVNGEIISEAIEYVPLGTFYLEDIESTNNNKTITLTAYDSAYRLDRRYTTSNTIWPYSAASVLSDIEALCGVTINNKIVFYSIDLPETIATSGYTCREVLGLIFSLLGKNAYVEVNGSISAKWYSVVDYAITHNLQYLHGLKKTTERDYLIGVVTSGTADNIITDGISNNSIAFKNPFITQSQVTAILNNVFGDTFTPCVLKYRGNPALRVGDSILVKDYNDNYITVYIMEHTLKIGGGMYGEIKCYDGYNVKL